MAHPVHDQDTIGRGSRRTTTADRVRHVIVSVSAVLAVLGAMVGSGALGGESMPEAVGGAFAADSTHLAPAGPAFSIWSVIYVGLVAYAVWQWLPAQAAAVRHRRVGYWIAASMLLNAAWLMAVQAALLWLTLVVMAALLGVLCYIFVTLRRRRPTGVADAVVTDGTIGLYLGWIVVATLANVAAVLAEAGLRESVDSPELWAVVVLAVGAVIGIALAWWGGGRLAPSAAIAWGLAWIAVARLSGDLVAEPVAYAATAAAAAVVIATVVARLRQPRTTAEGRGSGGRSGTARQSGSAHGTATDPGTGTDPVTGTDHARVTG